MRNVRRMAAGAVIAASLAVSGAAVAATASAAPPMAGAGVVFDNHAAPTARHHCHTIRCWEHRGEGKIKHHVHRQLG
jgi:hypothetical protein